MNDDTKTQQQLIKELAEMRERVTQLEKTEASLKQSNATHRESEEIFHLLVDQMTDSMIIIDWDGTIRFANETALKLVEVDSHTDILGRNITEYIGPNALQVAREDLAMIQAGQKGVTETYKIITASGQEKWVEAKGIKVHFQGSDCDMVNIRDITDRKQMEQDFGRTLESLRKAVGTTIQVMVSAVEARDPYTAGHQLRSADLCRSIATEMGLSREQIDGIRIAASIHDIGKLSIPADILGKPIKLNTLELSLVKDHARKGYEMLKDVESPWPLAQIIYQHHERMDGSGYPRNLKGEAILIESRILAVADVVEAMSSHRPYRPSLGIEEALKEIASHKGVLYDNDVVNACLRLFREKSYHLPEI